MTVTSAKKNNRIPQPSERELVGMMASLMALNALAIDTMLPAFPAMAAAFGLSDNNAIQYVISSYLLGMGLGSIAYGPLSDRYGRKAIMLPTVLGYAVFSFACSFSPSYEILLVLRLCQGLCGAAMAVLVAAVIRDRFEGDAMARRMSLIFMTFMIVPVIAPAVGSVILEFAPWRVIFDLFAVLGLVVSFWVWKRLPETIAPEHVIPIRMANIADSWRQMLTNRLSLGYVLAAGISQSALFGYLNASEQLFGETFNSREFFPIGFGIIAVGMSIAGFTNSRIVERFGARRVSQTATIIFISMAALQLLAAQLFPKSLTIFMVLLTINMAMVGFMNSNFSSISMQPFGKMAGVASSFQNTVRVVLATVIGAVIGQQFDGTVVPIAFGFCIAGIISLCIVFWAEHGKLFTRPRSAPKSPM